MRLRRAHAALAVLVSAWVGIAGGCPGSVVGRGLTGDATTGATAGGAATTSATAGGAATTSTTSITASSTSGGGQGGSACAAQCGPVELCDPAHLGFDDNCNGVVDEGCTCQPGQAHWCFKGDPIFRGSPGCFDGTELCTPQGTWGPCTGGVHAVPPDDCGLPGPAGCHAITAAPYTIVDLSTGLDTFGQNALPGSQTYAVACPEGVSQCPSVAGLSSFDPQQSGEYTVTYTKLVQGDPSPVPCTFPLIVGALGLRVELTWEHQDTDMGVDLDLHVHQPQDTTPWGISPPVEQDCNWANCVELYFEPPQEPDSPSWFAGPESWSPPTACPSPVQGLGCHDPRLDSDDIECNDTVTDPTNPAFCAAENTNIDEPPDQQWIRVAVDYYNNHGLSYDVHPEVKIFCDAGLAADLGPHGYYVPESPVTFQPADGAGVGGDGNRFWIAADVKFETICGRRICTVTPTYADATTLTPFFALDSDATQSFAPPYPP